MEEYVENLLKRAIKPRLAYAYIILRLCAWSIRRQIIWMPMMGLAMISFLADRQDWISISFFVSSVTFFLAPYILRAELIRLRKRAKARLEKNRTFLEMAQEFNLADNHEKAKVLLSQMQAMKDKKRWTEMLISAIILTIFVLALIAKRTL